VARATVGHDLELKSDASIPFAVLTITIVVGR